jgi:ABC-2 type transport system permease protein
MVIHADKLRWLFWLRWKLFLRGFTREKGRIVGAIFLVLFGLPLMGGLAVGTFFLYRYAPPPLNTEILFLVLTGIYIAWTVLPLLEYSVNEGLDLSKLVLFPLSRAELMMSLLFSTLLDIPMLGLILVFAAVVAGWAISLPVALLALVAMLIFYVQVVGISQLVLALLMRTLQSRRFRDLSIIIIVLFSSLCGIFAQLLGRIGNFVDLRHLSVSPYLQWLPPGMTARAIQQATLGNWGISFAWLTISLVISIVVLYLWQILVERSLSAPETGGAGRVRRHRVEQGARAAITSTPASTALLGRILSPQILAIAGKELKYYWRDPQLKATLFQSLVTSVFFIIWPLIGTSTSGSFTPPWIFILISPLVVFLAMLTLSLNSLGLERDSLTTLFLFPIEPQRILWGKNLAVLAIGLLELFLLVALGAFLSHTWNLVLPVLAIGLAGIAVVLGCGNFTSVFFPQRMRQMQRGFRASSMSAEGGCLRSVMVLVMMIVTAIVLIPVLLALALPIFFRIEWILGISIPAALIYGIAFHQAVTRLVALRMLDRVPEILAVTTRE